MRPVQLEEYAKAVWERSDVSLYCEVGMNGGHGTAAMLLANPKLHAITFDYGAWQYSNSTVDLLRLYFGSRFQFVRGSSQYTIPQFIQLSKGRVQCDVILVDGGHTASIAFNDLRNFRELAACNATVFMDDLNEGPGPAFRGAERAGWVSIGEWHMYNVSDRLKNPCIRTRTGGVKCMDSWGWGSAMYSGADACNRTAEQQMQPKGRLSTGAISQIVQSI